MNLQELVMAKWLASQPQAWQEMPQQPDMSLMQHIQELTPLFQSAAPEEKLQFIWALLSAQ